MEAQGLQVFLNHMHAKPGEYFNTRAFTDMLAEDVAQQSKYERKVPFEVKITGVEGHLGQGPLIINGKEEAVYIVAFSEGQDLWTILASGPNTARTQMMFREMLGSIVIARWRLVAVRARCHSARPPRGGWAKGAGGGVRAGPRFRDHQHGDGAG